MNKVLVLALLVALTGCEQKQDIELDTLEANYGLTTNADKFLFCSEVFNISSLKYKSIARDSNNPNDISASHLSIADRFNKLFKDTPDNEQLNAASAKLRRQPVSPSLAIEEVNRMTTDCLMFGETISFTPDA